MMRRMSRTILTILGLYLGLGLLEVFFPAHMGQTFRGRARNVFFTTILLLTGAAFLWLVLPQIPFQVTLHPNAGWGASALFIFASLFLTDLFFYWYHRAQHHFRWFWPIHELHHSDAELNATSSMRTYWLERPLQATFITLPIHYALGADANASLVVPFIFTGWLFFTHANLKLDMGFLTPILTGPQMHRIHHSNQPEHQDKNFAQFFPVIDMVFGTYYRPKKNEFPTTGTPGLASGAPIRHIFLKPFGEWYKLAKKS
jgi:sterol desaturase/sphingolipid hydroxylase (fatty acid hydroxylase superfamily)